MTLPELDGCTGSRGSQAVAPSRGGCARGVMTDQIKTALAAHKPALLARLGRDAQWEHLAAQALGTGPRRANRPVTRTDRFRPRR